MSLNILYERRAKSMDYRSDRNLKTPLRCAPHLHREVELIYYFSGETEASGDSLCCRLQPGDVFIAFPNQIHSFVTIQRERYLIFIFKPELVPEYTELFGTCLPASPVIRGVDKLPRVDALFRMLAQVCEDETLSNGEELQRGYLSAIFAELVPQIKLSNLQVGDSGALRTVVSYCSRNFSENLSLSYLEEKLHLNKYYISHLFSKRLGIRFNDYINSLRVSEACRYLLNSNHSITEISNMVGFNTLRTFNRAFIKQTGVSPSEYRRNDSASGRNV